MAILLRWYRTSIAGGSMPWHTRLPSALGGAVVFAGTAVLPEDPTELSAHAYVEHYKHSQRRDFTRAVIHWRQRAGSARKGARRAGTSSPPRRHRTLD